MIRKTYIDDLKARANEIGRKLAALRKRFEEADLGEKVALLEEIAYLETRQKDIAARLAEAEKISEADWPAWQQGLREDLEGVADAIERLAIKLP